MGDTRPRYGGLLVKKYEDDGMEIEVVDWTNVHFDPADIMGSPIIEDHYLHPSELQKRGESWENIDEVIKAHAKATKDKPAKILVKEVTGEFPESYDPEMEESQANDTKFKTMCFYVACINKKKFFLYKEDIKDISDKYKYLAWRKYGLGLGIGVWEDSFEGQAWVNDTVISIKRSMDISTKVVGTTTSKKVGGSLIKGIDHGHVFELEEGRTLDFAPLGATALPQFQTVIDLWNTQMDKGTSTYDANTGEAPTSGTPYSQTALLNQVANSPFEYQREVWGIFLNEILNDWIKPHLKRTIRKEHYLVSEFSDDELDLIDDSIANFDVNRKIVDSVLNQENVFPEDQTQMIEGVKESLKKKGKKREIDIPKGWLDVEGKITANITGELKNKGAILQSLDSILKTVVATFNPQTGEYSALTDPVLSKIFGQIVEMAGVPLASAQLNPGKAQAVETANPGAVSNVAPVTAPTQ
jgi:hypothetical protein